VLSIKIGRRPPFKSEIPNPKSLAQTDLTRPFSIYCIAIYFAVVAFINLVAPGRAAIDLSNLPTVSPSWFLRPALCAMLGLSEFRLQKPQGPVLKPQSFYTGFLSDPSTPFSPFDYQKNIFSFLIAGRYRISRFNHAIFFICKREGEIYELDKFFGFKVVNQQCRQ
jgi:hypothetical protein